jgi:hypothetical protein
MIHIMFTTFLLSCWILTSNLYELWKIMWCVGGQFNSPSYNFLDKFNPNAQACETPIGVYTSQFERIHIYGVITIIDKFFNCVLMVYLLLDFFKFRRLYIQICTCKLGGNFFVEFTKICK